VFSDTLNQRQNNKTLTGSGKEKQNDRGHSQSITRKTQQEHYKLKAKLKT